MDDLFRRRRLMPLPAGGDERLKGYAPATHSTIDAAFVGQVVAAEYALKGAVSAQLLYRGVNDVYVIRDDLGRYALRIWRAGTRSIAGVMQELDYLDFLTANGIPVSTSNPAADGRRFVPFVAIEGERPAVLYSWAHGVKFGDRLDPVIANRIGDAFAQMHIVSRDYRPAQDVLDDPVAALHAGMPSIELWVEDRADDVRDYRTLTETLSARLAELGALDLPQGMCHQDMHPSNVHLAPDGAITFLDFDGCAMGHWLHDVQNFVFGNAFYGFPAEIGIAFEQGYRTVRPFTADEQASRELFLLAKAFRLLGGASMGSASRGRDLLRLRNLDWFAGYIKPRARALGLL